MRVFVTVKSGISVTQSRFQKSFWSVNYIRMYIFFLFLQEFSIIKKVKEKAALLFILLFYIIFIFSQYLSLSVSLLRFLKLPSLLYFILIIIFFFILLLFD